MGEGARAKAGVLDASYLDRGRLDTDKVQRLAAELAARGAELWLPEVVVLEFAVHAWEDLTSNRQTHRRLRRAGLAREPELSDLGSAGIANELLKSCAAMPSIVIIEMTGESAIAGLRDQILGTGPAPLTRVCGPVQRIRPGRATRSNAPATTRKRSSSSVATTRTS